MNSGSKRSARTVRGPNAPVTACAFVGWLVVALLLAGCGTTTQAAPTRTVSAQGAPVDGAVASAVAATPPGVTTATAALSSTTSTTLRRPTPERPLVMWVAGDSLVAETGLALARLGESLQVVRVTVRVRDCSGLCRPDFFDWPALMKTDMIRFRPDAVVVMFGGNDGQDMRTEGQEFVAFTDQWKREYAHRVGEAMDILTRGGCRVFWIGGPVMRSAELSRQTGIMNAVYRQEADLRESVTYVDGWKLFSGTDGGFAERLPDVSGNPRLVREPDGVHLTGLGGERMAAEVLRLMGRYWELPLPAVGAEP
jgi:hypothetical protein